ncbi:MAG: 3-oxoadipate enol-lactonase [Flavobacteriaceae bacterium]
MPLTFIRANAITLHVDAPARRDLPALVFSNSLGTDFRIWNDVVARLSDRFACYRYDKRGHGLSQATEPPYAMADHVADLKALFDHFDIESAVVCGLSVGGMIAQGFALAHPDRVRGLVLCDTGHRIGTLELWNARIEAIGERGIAAISEQILERWFSREFRETRLTELDGWRNMLTRTPLAGYLGTSYALRDTDYTAETPRISVPTLCVVGEYDGSTPPALMRELSGLIAGSRYELIRDAGHLPPIEQAETLAGLILDFAGENGLG